MLGVLREMTQVQIQIVESKNDGEIRTVVSRLVDDECTEIEAKLSQLVATAVSDVLMQLSEEINSEHDSCVDAVAEPVESTDYI